MCFKKLMEKDCAKKHQPNVHGLGKEQVAIDFSVRFDKCNFDLVPPSFSFFMGQYSDWYS